MIDFAKAITAGKEDEIKKAQSVIVKRLIVGVIVFFIFVIVKLVVRIADENIFCGYIICFAFCAEPFDGLGGHSV